MALLLAHLQRLYLMDLHLQLDRQDARNIVALVEYILAERRQRERGRRAYWVQSMVAKKGIAGPI